MKQNRQYIFIIIFLQLVTGVLGILSNIVVNSLPDSWKPYFWIAWPFFGLFTIILIVVMLWQNKIGDGAKKHDEKKIPLNQYLPTEPPGKITYQVPITLPPAKLLETPLTWAELKQFAIQISKSGLARISSSFNKDFYLPRTSLIAEFEHFLDSDKVCFVLVGNSGVGKSSFLMWLHQQIVETKPELCMFVYDGAIVNPFMAMDDILSLDLQRFLPAGSSISIWHELPRMLRDKNNRMLVCIDAINENGTDPQELLRRIDEFGRRVSEHPIKVIITCRPEAWRIIKSEVFLGEEFYYRKTSGSFYEPESFNFSYELGYFNQDELRKAYINLARILQIKTNFDELSPEMQLALMDPLVLWLTAWKNHNGEMPKEIKIKKVIKDHINYLLSENKANRRLEYEDLEFLNEVVVPAMIRDGYCSNKVHLQDIQNGLSESQDISPLQGLSLNSHAPHQQVRHPLTRLFDSKILNHQGIGKDYVIFFEHERFWEYFGGFHFYQLYKEEANQGKKYLAMIRNLKDHPYMWGVLINALDYLMNECKESVVLDLASNENQDARDLVTTALVNSASENMPEIIRLAYKLCPKWYVYSVTPVQERRALVALEVARKLGLQELLERALQSRSEKIRDRAVVAAYKAWLENRKKGIEFLNRLVSQITFKTLIVNRELLPTCISLSLLIFFKFYQEENEIATEVQEAWKPVLGRFLLYNPSKAKKERFRNFLRDQVLRFIFNIIIKITKSIPNRYSIMSIGELKNFFRLPKDVKETAFAFTTSMMDPNYDIRQFEQNLISLYTANFNGILLNDMLVKLMIDYTIVAHGLRNLSGVLDILAKLAGMEIDQSTNSLRIMCDRSWVYGALAYLQRNQIDDRLFSAYTVYVGHCYQSALEWRGSIGTYAYVGYADYVYIYVNKYKSYKVDPLVELLEWAVKQQDHKKILDVLEELGYLASTAYWEAVLYIIQPALCYGKFDIEAHELINDIQNKLVEVLARIRSIHPLQVDVILLADQDLRTLLDKVRVRRTEEKIAGDLLKGGLGPWGQFEVSQAFSTKGFPILNWLFQQAVSSRDFNEFGLTLAKRGLNLIYGEDIFIIENALPAQEGIQ